MNIIRSILVRRGMWSITLAMLLPIVLVAGWFLWPGLFFHAYWFSLMFWTQLSIGALMVLLLQYLTGGRWGLVAVPFLSSVASGFHFLIPLFIPPLFALHFIFPWTGIRVGLSPDNLLHQRAWLNPGAFDLRTVIYLSLLGILVSGRNRPWFRSLAGPLLAGLILLISFASADWMMSLQPGFYSSIYPFLYFSGAMVGVFALLSGTMAACQRDGHYPTDRPLLLSYGKLLLAAVLFWAYIEYSQFIIIWTGNLPHEVTWYVARSGPAWLWLTLLVVIGHFAIPFVLLLSQRMKMRPGALARIAFGLLIMHFLEVFWMMRPQLGEGLRISVLDGLVPAAMGLGWLLWVARSPLFPSALFSREETHES